MQKQFKKSNYGSITDDKDRQKQYVVTLDKDVRNLFEYVDSLPNTLTSSKVVGTTDITAAGAETDMTNMTTTFTTYGTKLLTLFEAPIDSDGTASVVFNIYLNLDGTNVVSTCGYTNSDVKPISLHWLATGLTAGSHTVKVRWNAANTVHQKGTTYGNRVLSCTELF